jgi:hypothetical protein
VIWRRSTMISCRGTMISASLDAWAAQQEQPAKDSDHDQAWKAKRHKPRSCPRSTQSAKPQLTSLRPVVTRSTVDHFDDAAERDLDQELPIISSADAVARLGPLGFRHGHALDTWESHRVEKGQAHLAVTAMPAKHALTT